MVTTSIKSPIDLTDDTKYSRLLDEVVVFCPNCKTLETLTFSRNRLTANRKFIQSNSHIYHNCGSAEPCRLYRVG